MKVLTARSLTNQRIGQSIPIKLQAPTMGPDPAPTEDAPTLQGVLDALDDPDCRAILREAAQPMTAKELTETCDIPESTVYRKLDLLSTTALVREIHSVHPDRGRITRYQRDFDALNISLTDDNQFDVTINRPKRTVDERLATMWADMGDEL
jgi:predicted transcriptional regulator